MLKRDSQVCRAGGQARRASPATSPSSSAPTRWARPSAGRRCASPITPPARCSTASASSTIRASCCATRGSRSRRSPRATSAAGRPAPTTSCSRRLPVELRERKVANIRSVRPDVVATGNIGCISQLAIGMDIPIAHTVELLDWAYGGPVPRGLEGAVASRQGRARAQAGVCRHLRRPRALDSVAAPLTPKKACNPKVGRSWWRIGGVGRVDASRGRRTDARPSAALQVRGLRKAFATRVVDDLDLTVRAGELYALLGPNGAGKTTTLRMVAGLLPPDAGSIEIFGIDALADPIAAKRITAWLPDEPMLYDKLSPLEYLEFIAGLWGVERVPRRAQRRGAAGHPRAGAASPCALRGVLARHEAEGGAGRRPDPRSRADHAGRAADRARCRPSPAR